MGIICVSLMVCVLCLIIFIGMPLAFMHAKKLTPKEDYKDTIVCPIDTISPEREIFDYIYEIGIKHPDIVHAQAMLETGRLSSSIFIKYNNLFGMKKAYKRPSTAIDHTDDLYCIYRSWQESVIDYALFQTYVLRNRELSREEYYELLGSYAESENYVQTIKLMTE